MPPDATIASGAAVSLADYTRPEWIVPRLREPDTAGIIGELSQILHRGGCVPDVLPFYQAALNQELLTGSALECGLAIPHARLAGARQPGFAFGRTREPVIWGAKGPWRVQFIFLFAVPATDATRYLQLLSSLARIGRESAWLEDLRAAPDVAAILATLGRIPLRRER